MTEHSPRKRDRRDSSVDSYERRKSSSRRRSRSRSRDRSRDKSFKGSRRSRSRSPAPSRGGRGSNFQRQNKQRVEDAPASTVLGVFGLSNRTESNELRDLFEPFGRVENCLVIQDPSTGRSRGFGFVTFADIESATKAKESLTGSQVDGRNIRVDYSLTSKAHEPTPGRYMGPKRASSRDRGSRSYRDRSRSPRRYRSRSRSPRRRSRSRSRDRYRSSRRDY